MMRAILERYLVARAGVVVVSCGIVVSLVHVAVARDNSGVMQFFSSPEPAPSAHVARAEAAVTPREGRRSAPGRPLTVHANARRTGKGPYARKGKALKSLDFAAIPAKPAAVSIFEDRTLRRGDAVMTYVGIRIFAGSKAWPYSPRDFLHLAASTSIDLPFRQTLAAMDEAPRPPLDFNTRYAIRSTIWQ